MSKEGTKQNEFEIACEYGDLEAVKRLLNDPEVNPADPNSYPMGWAAYHGYTKIVELLLRDERIDPTSRNSYAIRWAVDGGKMDTVIMIAKSIKEQRK